MTKKIKSIAVTSFAIELSTSDFELQHKAGQYNDLADTLSRLQYNYDHKEECEGVTSGDIIKAIDCDIDNIETSDEEVLAKEGNISDKDMEEVFNVNVITDVCDNDIKTQQGNDNLCQSIYEEYYVISH